MHEIGDGLPGPKLAAGAADDDALDFVQVVDPAM
jgi:hypothetical protein